MSEFYTDREKELLEVFSGAMTRIMSDFYKKTLDDNLKLFIGQNVGELSEYDMRRCIDMLIGRYRQIWTETANMIIHVQRIGHEDNMSKINLGKVQKKDTAKLIDFKDWKERNK